MKNSKKIILFSILTLMILPLFLMQRTGVAQEWTYEGANTERIPDFSVYPSEWYLINWSSKPGWVNGEIPPEIYSKIVVAKGKITDEFQGTPLPAKGISVYVGNWIVNATSGDEELAPGGWTEETQLVWWNASWGYTGIMDQIIPVADDGKVSEHILNNVTYLYEARFHSYEINYTDKAIYPNIYSFRYWNTTDYLLANYTSDGILKKLEHTYMNFPLPNMTLISEPLQEAPDFDVKVEDGTLTVDSTEFKLNITIEDADNNNDQEIDTDYLYRIQNGTDWTDWADVPNLIDWDLGDVEAGNYDITVEVKNMYGVTQEEVTIEYSPPEKKGPDIFPVILTVIIICIVGVAAVITLILRKRIRGEKAVAKEIVEREIPPEKPEEPQESEKIEEET